MKPCHADNCSVGGPEPRLHKPFWSYSPGDCHEKYLQTLVMLFSVPFPEVMPTVLGVIQAVVFSAPLLATVNAGVGLAFPQVLAVLSIP